MDAAALRDYFEHTARLRQRLGVYDCVVFVVDVLLYGFGRDFRHELGYWDRRSACARLRAAGGLREAFSAALGPERLIEGCPPGTVAYFDRPAFVGIVLPNAQWGDYIAVKGNRAIHRFEIEPHRTGWRTD